jgi:hypothetical protein
MIKNQHFSLNGKPPATSINPAEFRIYQARLKNCSSQKSPGISFCNCRANRPAGAPGGHRAGERLIFAINHRNLVQSEVVFSHAAAGQEQKQFAHQQKD